MRIACVVKARSGANWFVRQVHAMVARGHSVTAFVPVARGPLGAAFEAAGARVVSAPTGFGGATVPFVGLNALRLRRQLARERPDVIFYQLWASAVTTRLAAAGLPHARRVHMVPGPMFLEQPLSRLVEQFMVRLDDHVIAGSRHTSQIYAGWGLPPTRLSTVAYGADVQHFAMRTDADRLEARRQLGLPDDAFVAVMVSYVYGGKRLAHSGLPIKGHADLLEAWQTLRPAVPRPKRLLIVGGGFDARGEAHRRDLIERYRIATDPEILWVESVADVRPYYRAADVSVSPSLSDNHGAAVEASAMGVPSIVSDAGGLPEVVAGSGWVFPRGDAKALQARLLEASSLTGEELSALGMAARNVAESQFDADACARQVVRIIERVARQ